MTDDTTRYRIRGGAGAGHCLCHAPVLRALDGAASLELLAGAAVPARVVISRLAAAAGAISALSIETPSVADLARRIEAIALLSDTMVAEPTSA